MRFLLRRNDKMEKFDSEKDKKLENKIIEFQKMTTGLLSKLDS